MYNYTVMVKLIGVRYKNIISKKNFALISHKLMLFSE